MQRKRMSHNGYAATVETTLDEHGYRAEVTCDDGWISSGRAPTAIGARRLAMRAARVAGMRVDTSIQDEIDDARSEADIEDAQDAAEAAENARIDAEVAVKMDAIALAEEETTK